MCGACVRVSMCMPTCVLTLKSILVLLPARGRMGMSGRPIEPHGWWRSTNAAGKVANLAAAVAVAAAELVDVLVIVASVGRHLVVLGSEG